MSDSESERDELNERIDRSEVDEMGPTSDDERGERTSDSEPEDNEEHTPEKVSIELSNKYGSFAAFEEDLRRYSAATYQTFIIRRSEKLKKTNAQFDTIKYKKLVYKCVHHSQYKSEGDGKRPFQHSRKKNCTAEIRLSAQLRSRVVEVITRNGS